MIFDYIKLLRPKQWTKNLILFAPILFSGRLFEYEILLETVFGFIIFCMISSSVYILNDILDVERDRVHHKKKNRPIASGKVSISVATILFVVVLLMSLVLGYLLNTNYFCLIILYFVINMLYVFRFKHIVILDVITLSTVFLLRAIAGSALIETSISSYLLLAVILLALFLALNKRRSEKIFMEENNVETREILNEYSVSMIDKMLAIITPATLMAYILFALDDKHSPQFVFTTFFVVYGLFRYIFIADKTDLAESPEYALLHDKPLLINILLWVLSCFYLLYF